MKRERGVNPSFPTRLCPHDLHDVVAAAPGHAREQAGRGCVAGEGWAVRTGWPTSFLSIIHHAPPVAETSSCSARPPPLLLSSGARLSGMAGAAWKRHPPSNTGKAQPPHSLPSPPSSNARVRRQVRARPAAADDDDREAAAHAAAPDARPRRRRAAAQRQGRCRPPAPPRRCHPCHCCSRGQPGRQRDGGGPRCRDDDRRVAPRAVLGWRTVSSPHRSRRRSSHCWSGRDGARGCCCCGGSCRDGGGGGGGRRPPALAINEGVGESGGVCASPPPPHIHFLPHWLTLASPPPPPAPPSSAPAAGAGPATNPPALSSRATTPRSTGVAASPSAASASAAAVRRAVAIRRTSHELPAAVTGPAETARAAGLPARLATLLLPASGDASSCREAVAAEGAGERRGGAGEDCGGRDSAGDRSEAEEAPLASSRSTRTRSDKTRGRWDCPDSSSSGVSTAGERIRDSPTHTHTRAPPARTRDERRVVVRRLHGRMAPRLGALQRLARSSSGNDVCAPHRETEGARGGEVRGLGGRARGRGGGSGSGGRCGRCGLHLKEGGHLRFEDGEREGVSRAAPAPPALAARDAPACRPPPRRRSGSAGCCRCIKKGVNHNTDTSKHRSPSPPSSRVAVARRPGRSRRSPAQQRRPGRLGRERRPAAAQAPAPVFAHDEDACEKRRGRRKHREGSAWTWAGQSTKTPSSATNAWAIYPSLPPIVQRTYEAEGDEAEQPDERDYTEGGGGGAGGGAR